MNMAGMAMKRDQGPDLNDVTYDAFLANDRTLADPQTIKVEQGGQLLLRVINGSAMSNFHLYIGALGGELIAADGFEVKPIAGKTFPIAVAQRLDIRIRLPAGAGAYPIFALLEGTSRRTGIVLDAGGQSPKCRIRRKRSSPRSRSISNVSSKRSNRYVAVRQTRRTGSI
jgi:FtsP/CotA-like multicopper oxidase with cupredoxin domain